MGEREKGREGKGKQDTPKQYVYETKVRNITKGGREGHVRERKGRSKEMGEKLFDTPGNEKGEVRRKGGEV